MRKIECQENIIDCAAKILASLGPTQDLVSEGLLLIIDYLCEGVAGRSYEFISLESKLGFENEYIIDFIQSVDDNGCINSCKIHFDLDTLCAQNDLKDSYHNYIVNTSVKIILTTKLFHDENDRKLAEAMGAGEHG